MNLTRFVLRMVMFGALVWPTTSVTFGQGEGWWRGIFKPKSEPIDVHAPASPAAGTSAPADSTMDDSSLPGVSPTTSLPDSSNAEQPETTSETATDATKTNETIAIRPGTFVLQQPARLDTLDSLWRLNPPAVSGFRVQVFLGDLNAARAERASLRKITNEPVYLQAMPPSYGLMVGDFHDKWAAERLRMEWADLYPNALTIPTDINPMRLPERATEEADAEDVKPSESSLPRRDW